MPKVQTTGANFLNSVKGAKSYLGMFLISNFLIRIFKMRKNIFFTALFVAAANYAAAAPTSSNLSFVDDSIDWDEIIPIENTTDDLNLEAYDLAANENEEELEMPWWFNSVDIPKGALADGENSGFGDDGEDPEGELDPDARITDITDWTDEEIDKIDQNLNKELDSYWD